MITAYCFWLSAKWRKLRRTISEWDSFVITQRTPLILCFSAIRRYFKPQLVCVVANRDIAFASINLWTMPLAFFLLFKKRPNKLKDLQPWGREEILIVSETWFLYLHHNSELFAWRLNSVDFLNSKEWSLSLQFCKCPKIWRSDVDRCYHLENKPFCSFHISSFLQHSSFAKFSLWLSILNHSYVSSYDKNQTSPPLLCTHVQCVICGLGAVWLF